MTKDGIAPIVGPPSVSGDASALNRSERGDASEVSDAAGGLASAFDGPGFEDALADMAQGQNRSGDIHPDTRPEHADTQSAFNWSDNLGDYQLQPAEESPAQALVSDSGEATSNPDWQSGGPLLPSDEWTTAESVKKRQYLLIGLLGFFGILLAALGFVAFLRWASAPDDNGLAATDPQADATAPLDGANLDPAAELNQNPDPDADLTQDPSPGDTTTLDQDQNSGEGLPADPVGETESTSDPATDGGLLAGGTDTMVPDATPGQEGDAVTQRNGDARDDSTSEFKPEDPFGTDESGDETTADAGPILPNEWLQQFAPMLQWQVAPSLPDEGGAPGPAPVTAKDLNLDSSSDREPIPHVDWQDVANRNVVGLILGEAPPAESASLLAQTTGVPTTVDLDSLKAAKIDTSAKVALGKFQSLSIGTIVQQITANSGLIVEPKENRYLELHGNSDAIEALLPEELDVSDLFNSDDEAGWLVSALEAFFPETKNETRSGWAVSGMRLTRDRSLVDTMKWFEAVRMLETMRFAAGKPSQVDSYEGQAIFNRFVDADTIPALNEPVQELFVQAPPIAQSISRLGQRGGIHVWFDWPSLGEIGVGPATTGVVFTGGRSLSKVLKSFADQFGFTIAIESENDLWITSPRAYRRQARIYVLPSGGRTAEQWQEQLGFELTPLNEEGIGRLTAILSPDKSVVVLRCCRPKL